MRSVLLRLVTASARQEREAALQKLQQAAPRLGSLGVRRKGIDVQEVREVVRAEGGAGEWLQLL